MPDKKQISFRIHEADYWFLEARFGSSRSRTHNLRQLIHHYCNILRAAPQATSAEAIEAAIKNMAPTSKDQAQ